MEEEGRGGVEGRGERWKGGVGEVRMGVYMRSATMATLWSV